MTRLFVVRHGQSTWNADGRWQGHADPPLSRLGERQSEAAVARAEGLAIAAVWTSPLARACRTAEIISSGLGLSVCTEEGLRERDVGEWTGLTRVEIEERWPGFLVDGRRPPGFEPDDALRERGLAAIGRIVADAGDETILVVGHGGLIRVVERHLGGEAPPMANLGGRWVTADGSAVSLGERVLLVDPGEVTVTVPGQI